MRKLFSIFFVIIIICTSCKKEPEGNWFIIEIKAQKDINCGGPVISFVTGINEAKFFLSSNSNSYVATGLPKVNYKVGDQLTVAIKKPDGQDAIACLTLGINWPQVVITEVR